MYPWIVNQPEVQQKLEQLPPEKQEALNARMRVLVQEVLGEVHTSEETLQEKSEGFMAGYGAMKGKIHLGEDFDDPIPGMEEYM